MAIEISPMVRTAIFVADLERSIAFYRDVLGLEEIFLDATLNHPAIPPLLGTDPKSVTRCRIVKAPGPAVGMVGLFEVSNPAPPALAVHDGGVRVGEAAIVFYAANLDPVMAALSARNHPVFCPPVHFRYAGPGQREMTFRDPDGQLINVIERDPAVALAPRAAGLDR